MIPVTGIRRLVRAAAPWMMAALCLEIGLRIVWPLQLESALADRSIGRRLTNVLPNEPQLRATIQDLANDSARFGDRLALARSRQIEGADPAAILATRIVPMLAARGWKLDRVNAVADSGIAVLDIGATTSFEQGLQGLEDIRMLPFSVRFRKLSLRPGSSGRLALDLQISVPARSTP